MSTTTTAPRVTETVKPEPAWEPGSALRFVPGAGTCSMAALVARRQRTRTWDVIYLDTAERTTADQDFVGVARESASIFDSRAHERGFAGLGDRTRARYGKYAVLIENVYADGFRSARVVEVDAPTGAVEDWWDDVVYAETGDEASTPGVGSCYTATVLRTPTGGTVAVGAEREWID